MSRKWLFCLFLAWFFFCQASDLMAAKYGDELGDCKGVIAYHNGEPAGNTKGDHQCVAYVKRFYSQIYHLTLGPVGKASKAFAVWGARNDFLFYSQGSSTLPVPDDILCFSGGSSGHVAIVTEITESKAKIIEQNFSTRNCRRDLAITRSGKGYLISDGGTYKVQGWLHYKGNKAQTTPKPLDFLSGSITTVLVVDSSNSMANKMKRSVTAACTYIDLSRDWDSLALVSFALKGQTLHNCVGLRPDTNRQALKRATGKIAPDDWTNIGAGLDLGYNQLTKAPTKSRKVALLLSDGGNNRGDLRAAVNRFVKADWPIYTIAYGYSDDMIRDRQTLIDIANQTGGAFFDADTSNIAQVYHKVCAHSRLGSVVISYNDSIEQDKTLRYYVEITKDFLSAVFHTDWFGSQVDLRLTTPKGKRIDKSNYRQYPGVRFVQEKTYSFFQIDQPEPGQWQVELYGADIPQKEQVNLTVSGTSPLMFNSLMTSPYYRYDAYTPTKVVISAKVAEIVNGQAEALSKVEVIAWIHKPEPSLIGRTSSGKIGFNLGGLVRKAISGEDKIYLYDDGQHGDGRANDGVFAAVYDKADLPGPYAVDLRCIAQTKSGQQIDRLIRESFQVGDLNANAFTLSQLVNTIR